MLGTVVGTRYRTIRLLGRGGMGEVYEATDERDGKRVALKLVHYGDGSGHSEDLVSRKGRFLREAKVAASVDSDHVARVLDWGTDDAIGLPFMVMELLEGEDLQRVFKRVDVLPPDVVLRIGAQVCKGLAKAHEARILHRDIKPANLFLAAQPGGDLAVKILDFGIAKVHPGMEQGLETTGLTRTGAMLGSPLYMSPEQARGSAKLDERSDLWSLGVVMYRALTGHLPHEKAEAFGEYILVLCSERPRPVQQLAPWVSPEIAAMVGRALQIDRDRRFADAKQMLAAIEALLPGDDRIRPEMLAPLDDASRASVARRLAPSSPDLKNEAAIPPERPASPDGPSTVSGAVRVSGIHPVPRRLRASSALVVAVAAVAASLGALAVMRAMSSPGAVAPGAAQGASSSTAERDRTVSVVILPADVSVEIEGRSVAMRDGMIELSGPLGSRHRVTLIRGAQRLSADVVIADGGAVPPKLELAPAPEDKPAPSAQKPAPAPQVKPAPTAKPAAPARRDPLIPERFE
ncbi:MAG: serine/threonine-protein kinase [Byssovorax sp.]